MNLAYLIPIVSVLVGVPGFVVFVALLIGHTRRMKELLQERLDFAERVLVAGTPPERDGNG